MGKCGSTATMALLALGLGSAAARAATVEDGPTPLLRNILGASQGAAAMDAGGAFAVPNPYASGLSNSDIDINRLTIFGDSYSALKRKTFPNWAEQMKADGEVASLAGFAKSGAVARTDGTNTFLKQYNAWLKTKPTFAANDLTVVYLGYNDIDSYADLSQSYTDYRKTVLNLIAKGATGGDRRLFLVVPHDWGRNPEQAGDPDGVYRQRSLDWRDDVTHIASQKSHVVAVDLLTAFDKVYADPKKYGFVNITVPNPRRSGSTYLYDDTDHFGQRGQQLIKRVFEYYLTRGWDAANTLQAGDQAAARLNQDIDAGLVFNGNLLTAEEHLGLTAFPVGQAAFDDADLPGGDLARAGFDEVYAPDQRDGGVGVNYELGGGNRFGVVIAHYDEDVRSRRDLSTARGEVDSDSVAVYLQNSLAGFELGTRFLYSADDHQQRRYDDFVGQGDRASFGGSVTELSQRLGYPVELAGVTLTPWTQLTQRSQAVDSFTLSSPYVSDTGYATSTVNDTEASLGLDAASEPLSLGEEASLVLFGGLSYRQSLVRDDYRVRIREQSLAGYTDQETVARPELHTVGLSFGARMQLGERLQLGGGLGLSYDPAEGNAGQAMLNLAYRF